MTRARRSKVASVIFVDTLGLMVGLVVHSTDIQDRDGAVAALKTVLRRWPWLRHIFADGGYAGPKRGPHCARSRSSRCKSSREQTRQKTLKCCRVAGSRSAHSLGLADASLISAFSLGGSQGTMSIEDFSSQALDRAHLSTMRLIGGPELDIKDSTDA
jgi:hypothetical protein